MRSAHRLTPMHARVTIVLLGLLTLAGCASLPSTEREEQASAAVAVGRYAEAEVIYRELVDDPWNRQRATNALFNLAVTVREQGHYDEAIRLFESFAAREGDPLAPGAHLMEPYRNGRAKARWGIAHCFRLKGDYAEALRRYTEVETRTPFRSWCGNESAANSYWYRLYTGVCLEHLGQPDVAARHYLAALSNSLFYFDPLASMRLVELYRAAGQLDDLGRILDEMDAYSLAQARAANPQQPIAMTDAQLLAYSPTQPVRQLVELTVAGSAGQRNLLIKHLPRDRRLAEAPIPERDWIAIEAVRLLALTPGESTAALLEVARDAQEPFTGWIAYALGRCGTDEGVAWLASQAREPSRRGGTSIFTVALGLAGPVGERAFDEIARGWTPEVREWARQNRDAGRATGIWRKDIEFAVARRDARLPKTLSGLRLE